MAYATAQAAVDRPQAKRAARTVTESQAVETTAADGEGSKTADGEGSNTGAVPGPERATKRKRHLSAEATTTAEMAVSGGSGAKRKKQKAAAQPSESSVISASSKKLSKALKKGVSKSRLEAFAKLKDKLTKKKKIKAVQID